jgi:hypothetical protein
MTAAAVPVLVPTAPPRPAWHGLVWLGPLTALWLALTIWQPIIQASGFTTTLHQLSAHGLIALGLWLGLERTDLTPAQRRTTWLAVMIPDTLWFAVVWSAAMNNGFPTGVSALPVLPAAIFLPVIIGVPLLLTSRRVGQVLDAMPAQWLVTLQIYRVFGIWPVALWLHGALTGLSALPQGTGDLLTGLFALPAAIAVATGTAQGRRAAILWNILGITDFAVAVTMGMLTTPGRFQLIVPAIQSTNAGAFPGVLTPAFVVPCSILLHALSLRQLRRRGTAAAARG